MNISTIKHLIEKYRHHIIVWMIFVAYETVIVFFTFGTVRQPTVYFAHYAVTIFLFYALGDFLLPGLAEQKNKILLSILLLLVYIISYILLHVFADMILTIFGVIKSKPNFGLNKDFIFRNTYRGIYFMGFAVGYSFIKTYLIEHEKAELLKREKLLDIIKQQEIEQSLVLAQNAILKAQINPHFLFNTLDFVYHSVNEQSPSAGEAIVRLSQMMRHAINAEAMGDFVALADEIEHVENLIYLYQIRKDEGLNLLFHYDSHVLKLRLIPLILLTLVENIFKHGDLSNPNDKAIVNVGVSNDYFFIDTKNLISHDKSILSNSYGLQNIEKRLLHIYGNNINFEFGADENQHFNVSLFIPLNYML